LPESDLPKIKSVFWHNNIIAFAPVLELPASMIVRESQKNDFSAAKSVTVLGTWYEHPLSLSDGSTFLTGLAETNRWWHLGGIWFAEDKKECVLGARLAERLHVSTGADLTLISAVDASGVTQHDGGSSFRETLKVTGVVYTGGPEDEFVIVPLSLAQQLANKPGQYRKLYVSALTKPEDDFARRDPRTMKPEELERWSCSPYVSSIAYSIKQVLPGSDVRVIRRIADGEGKILTRVRTLLWLVTFASLLAAALAVGASSAASVIERRTEIGLMKALGAGSGTVGWLLAAEQLLLAFVGGCAGYALGLVLARFLGTKIFGVPPEPSLLVLGVILVLAATVTLLGSALPLRRAARFDPAPILRGE
jgi:putative ABC transport system permease protein